MGFPSILDALSALNNLIWYKQKSLAFSDGTSADTQLNALRAYCLKPEDVTALYW